MADKGSNPNCENQRALFVAMGVTIYRPSLTGITWSLFFSIGVIVVFILINMALGAPIYKDTLYTIFITYLSGALTHEMGLSFAKHGMKAIVLMSIIATIMFTFVEILNTP